LIDDIDLDALEDDLLLEGGTYPTYTGLVQSKAADETQDDRPVVNRWIAHQLGLG